MSRALIASALLAATLAACDRKPAPPVSTLPPTPTPKPVVAAAPTPPPTPTPAPPPTPAPTPYVPIKSLQTGSIFNGIQYRANLETTEGTTASADREKQDSYTVEINVKVKVPKPHRNLEELRKLNDKLDKVLPGLAALMPTAKVSQDYDDLYRTKINSLRTNLNKLDALLSRHNFYDCETILELQHPQTKRRAILIQADMDVDTDGADGDRLYTVDNSSRTFQPFTSYRWDKKTQNPNPCVPHWEKRIAENEAKIKEAKGADAQKLKTDNARLRLEVKEMERFSFLIGAADPFIVIPTPMVAHPRQGPAIGDYCVVIYGDTLYPGIIGDAGPTTKMGEASLRICRQINAQATGAYRAVADLKVTYLIFPASTERPMTPPNYAQWRAKCEQLLNEIGGYQGQLFEWPDITRPVNPPPPPPVVTPPPAVPSATPAAPAPAPGTAPATVPATPAAPAAPTTPPAGSPATPPPATPGISPPQAD